MELTMQEIAAMAVAAVAEEEGLDAKALRIVTFREAGESALAKYLRETGVPYKKYQLGD